MKPCIRILLFILLFCSGIRLSAQVRVSGTVYEITKNYPLASVSVLSVKGRGTETDSAGRYSIVVAEDDSIYFSYLGKGTPKYAVSTIPSIHQFDVALHVNVTVLREVRVMPRSYKADSLRNREEYAKAFNFHKPGIGTSSSPPASGNFGVGLDLDQLINMFRFRRNRSMAAFQDRLVKEEQDKYIEYRFSRAKIRRITGLTGEDIDAFYRYYAPSYEFVQDASEYELLDYMKKAGEQYKRIKAMGGNFGSRQ